MEPLKTAKRGSKISSRVESPPPSSLEKPEAVPAADVPELAPEAATANDGPSQKDPVAPPAIERKKPAPHTTADSKKSANDAEDPEESSKAAVAAPDFGLSGKLAAETNTVNGVVLKYAEPPEARKPKDPWRLYVFKDGKDIDMHHVDRASGYLFGRDRKATDVPTDHPSCSSQHAVLQFRQTTSASPSSTVKPYLIDLSSTNGTFLNGEAIPTQRFVELRSEDVIKFGFSTREYVLLSE
ncbi:hypothetical protein GGI00_001854 [Coemansia sp. RSA 2681]|nr:hypothetical protein GGI00_001854 [Coemansia sp. RSA 2681]